MSTFISLPVSCNAGKHVIVPARGKHRAHIVGWLLRCEHEGTRLIYFSSNDDDGKPVSGELVMANAEVDDRLIRGPVGDRPAPLVSAEPDEKLELKSLAGKATVNGVVQVWYEPIE